MTDTQTATLWQIGREYSSLQIEPREGNWFSEYNYTVEIDSDPINQPTIPQLIAIPQTQTAGTGTLSTGKLNIYFTLDRNYKADELTLFYGCFGAQENRFLLDGQPLSNPVSKSDSKELQQLEISLPEITVGDHILTITVSGEQQDPDYQTISYLKLEALLGEEVDLLPMSNPSPTSSPWQQFSDDLKSLNIWSMLS